MKILLINKYNYLKGGSETYLFNLEKLLKARGHQVKIFSMKHPQNRNDDKFFIAEKDFENLTWYKKIFELKNIFYRKESVIKLNQLLNDFQPDLAHLNNINFQLTTSIIDLLKKKNVPLVMTLHDYQLICPDHLLYNSKGSCFKCRDKKFINCLINNCYQDNFSLSLMAALESYYNHLRGVYKKIDAFISPSDYLKDKMVEFGFNENTINVFPNFLFLDEYARRPLKDNYFLYVGRLNQEKGLNELLDFFIDHKQWSLKIIGDGLLKEKVEQAAQDNIEYLGKLPHEKVKDYLAKAQALIFPSNWPENCPYVVLESLALNTPVVAKPSGGINELILDGINGFIFHDYNNLPMILKKIAGPTTNRSLRAGALKEAQKYMAESYYLKLISLYQALTKK